MDCQKMTQDKEHICFAGPFFSVLSHNFGRWSGHTDDFATIPFHPVLFSAALGEFLVHFLILSCHLFFSRPLLLFPLTMPCMVVFAKPEDLETGPHHLSFRFLTMVSSSYSGTNGPLDLSANNLVASSLYEMFNSLR